MLTRGSSDHIGAPTHELHALRHLQVRSAATSNRDPRPTVQPPRAPGRARKQHNPAFSQA
eukprot:10039649-Alexandrium_andersonii.AAC.1